MGRALLVLETPADRGKAVHWITKAPVGTRVEFKASKRSLPQNDLMWALLTDFAQQYSHNGKKYDPTQWKAIFLHAFGREVTFLPSLDGNTFLPIELSSSDLSKDEMTNFIEFILKEAAERGVILHIPKEQPESGSSPHPEPDADEAPSPASSAEIDESPSSSISPIPDASTPDGGPAPGEDPARGETSPSQPPAGSNPERDILIRYARDVLPMAAERNASGAALSAIEKEYAATEFKALSPSGLEKAKAISRSMRAIFNNETSLRSALSHYSDMLECSPAEIGGGS